MYTDTHFHMAAMQEKGIDIPALLSRMEEEGYEGIDIGTVADDLPARRRLLAGHAFPLSAGIGPWGVGQPLDALRANIAACGPVCAIGEIGLDNHWKDYGTPAQQEALFEAQIGLADELHLPIIIHSREADAQMERILLRHTFPRPGIMHCFEGGRRLLDVALRQGFFISFSGVITYKHNEWLADLLTLVPDDRLLLETDSPYLAPVPVRGRTNTPLNIPHTYAFAAKARGISVERLQALVRANLHAFLGKPGASPEAAPVRDTPDPRH